MSGRLVGDGIVRRAGGDRGVRPEPRGARVGGATSVPPSGSADARASAPVLGRSSDPSWSRSAFWVLLALSAFVYFVDLSVNAYANNFYAAAVKSGTQSWSALLFGAIDSGGSITVDKPPASLWLMSLSGRLFGFSSWSMLAPQALLGVATVGLTHATVKRWAGAVTGLLAGLIVLVTPVAALMFRFNNPDALLTFAMVAAAYCVTRATESTSRATRWMLGAGALIGLAFLTKLLQGLLVLPAFAAVYLLVSSAPVAARIRHLLAALGAFIVSAGWYVALVSLWPAADRPFIGGSTNNSLWQLALGYDGLGRLFGGTGGSGVSAGGGGGANFAGTTGIGRLFASSFGTEISWLLPSALLLLVAGLVARGRAPRTDRLRAGLVLWGTWTLVTGLVFSFMEGTVHPYYSVALAPGIAGTIAVGAVAVWQRRDQVAWRAVLALSSIIAAGWATYLLHRDAAGWMSWLGWAAIALSAVGAISLLRAPRPAHGDPRRRLPALTRAGLVTSLAGALLAPTVWMAATLTVSHTDSNPTAGPANVLVSSDMHGGPGAGRQGRPSTAADGASSGTAPSRPTAGTGTAGGPGGSGGGGEQTADTAVVALLNATTSKWSAATVGAQAAAPYILASNTSVMPIGGFVGEDASPTLAQFEADVAAGQIHYFIVGGGMRGGSDGTGAATAITSWVESHFKTVTVGGVTLYDLTQPIAGA